MSDIGSTHFYYMTLTFYFQNMKCAEYNLATQKLLIKQTHSMAINNFHKFRLLYSQYYVFVYLR